MADKNSSGFRGEGKILVGMAGLKNSIRDPKRCIKIEAVISVHVTVEIRVKTNVLYKDSGRVTTLNDD